jgi:phosphonoacetaldehyde hydrolase
MGIAHAPRVRLVVCDWAGTLIDHGCCAPVVAFRAMFARHGVYVTDEQVRSSMGLDQRAHIEAMLGHADICEQWQDSHGCAPGSGDVNRLFRDFVPAQLKALAEHSQLIEGVDRTLGFLRRRQIAVATTTAYFSAAAQRVLDLASAQGFAPDYAVCNDDVSMGLPAPWMIYACMDALGIYPAESVIAIGDTAAAVQAARSAGCVSVGLARTGNAVGLSELDWSLLTNERQAALLDRARAALTDAGADHVIDTMAELPALIEAAPRRSDRRSRRLALDNPRSGGLERAVREEAPRPWH